MILDQPSVLVRLEGLAIFVAAAYLYASAGWNLLLFVILFLAIDLGMLGYLAGFRVGAMIYNLFHLYLVPIILLALGSFLVMEILMQIGLIWLAHIAADRALGYGLKTTEGFKVTHIQWLQRVEKSHSQ